MPKRSVLIVAGGAALLILLAACGQQAAGQPEPPAATAGQTPADPVAAPSPTAGQTPAAPTEAASPAAQLPTNQPIPQVSVEPVPAQSGNTSEVPQAVLQQMAADLAGRLGVDPAAIKVTTAEAITWPDGALGCPEPGAFYQQVLIDGYRVILATGGAEYAYHGSVDGRFLLCEQAAPRPRP